LFSQDIPVLGKWAKVTFPRLNIGSLKISNNSFIAPSTTRAILHNTFAHYFEMIGSLYVKLI
jgi:hypothetical protein